MVLESSGSDTTEMSDIYNSCGVPQCQRVTEICQRVTVMMSGINDYGVRDCIWC
jgi:hypothetical protein